VLPGVLGYACFHPCEDDCRRRAIDDSASICALKRYAAEFSADVPPRIIKRNPTGKKIAVIGGGPAGLAASAELLRRGHAVTVFERDSKLGGMLRQTIPNFRLPEEVIDRDLEYLFELGLETRFGKFIGDEDLKAEGFDALIRTVGLPEAIQLGVEGEDYVNVVTGLDFLRDAISGEFEPVEGDDVVIIGGGAVAVDVAMTARRLGAKTVLMVCLEAPDEMPAFEEELVTAREEGIFIINRWGVERIEGEDGTFKRIFLKRCTRVFNEYGRFQPEFDPDETKSVRAERLIVAIGQKHDSRFAVSSENSNVDAIAGDAAIGASSIVKAMADGIRAAIEVNDKLNGPDAPEFPEFETAKREIGREPGYYDRGRVIPVHVKADVRAESMEIFVDTISPEQARQEAARCLRCNLRSKIIPAPLPPDLWKNFDEDILKFVPEEDGVLILANEDKVSVKIAGAANLNELAEELLDEDYEAEYCRWELDPMYTKRESELIQAHLQAYGEIPSDDDMDDLF